MKLSNTTLTILKNFASINPSILINKGNIIKTCSPLRTVIAKATLDQEFPAEFAIYDLSNLLSALSLFDEPELNFNDECVTITDNIRKAVIKYYYASPTTIITPPAKDIPIEGIKASFNLPYIFIEKALNAANILSVPEIVIEGNGKNISILAADKGQASKNSYIDVITETTNHFKLFFKKEHFNILKTEYKVIVPKEVFVQFKNDIVEYIIVCEKESVF